MGLVSPCADVKYPRPFDFVELLGASVSSALSKEILVSHLVLLEYIQGIPYAKRHPSAPSREQRRTLNDHTSEILITSILVLNLED